jgi:hypothetical protein
MKHPQLQTDTGDEEIMLSNGHTPDKEEEIL